ncbi:cysteine desulfurase [Flavobacterium sp. xlx-214]|uniref:aminotransferase class V-fold PLP-dependent enzyme n=1 Tax=unclassified Flavobacterium TaxID=196869 RepID=UPI0013D0D469|nr:MULTISPECIES: cysteine desulfurase [unclassified Flavobacterium]MBA5792055.1 cysteine desulfurase [Flavobacterium sp. xlx-221]QMI84304.1 cysteine desulfurase [Flavobacterium sp. xlx-214]
MTFDINKIRADFPILSQQVNGKPLVYFDNGATAQKPQVVIDAEVKYYSEINANIHRGVHHLSQVATDAYEEARIKLQKHINAKNSFEVLFTAGTTFGINLVANGFGQILQAGDEVIVSHLEHHSNIVPWQFACERSGATLKVIPMLPDGSLDMDAYVNLLNKNTKVVAVNHISNALGTINPIKFIIDKAHEVGAAVLIDGAQATPHLKPDVQALDCDFYVFSGHKICGPTGTGVLYGKEKWLNALPPYQGGGEMIKEVTFEKTTYACLPHKFEAGTPNIAGGIVLGVAVDYLNEVGFNNIAAYEKELLDYGTQRLSELEGIEFYGTTKEKASVISFNFKGIHPYDVGAIIDKLGIAVRTGHHCAQPIMNYFDIPGTIRASFAFYNTKEEIDAMIEALKKAQQMLS